MPATKKKNSSKERIRLISVRPPRTRIDKNMPDFNKDPFFVKKAEEASAFLREHPLPEEILEKIRGKRKK